MRTSPHEIALPDLLAVAELRGLTPPELVVLGLRPDSIELGWELSAAVAAQLDTLVDAAATQLRRWGMTLGRERSRRMHEIAAMQGAISSIVGCHASGRW